MNASIRVVRTQAETDLAEQFERSRTSLAGGAEIAALRNAAFDRFSQTGLPHRRVEEWKYTDLRAYMKGAAPLADPVTAQAAGPALEAADAYGGLERFRLVLANGRLVAELSDLNALDAAGVTVRDINDGLANSDAAKLLQCPAIAQGNALVDLNTALVQGGVTVAVEAGRRVDKPVEIVHLTVGAGASFSRCRIALGEGAELTLLESFASVGAGGETNAVSDYDLGKGAILASVRLMSGAGSHAHVSTSFARLAGDAHLKTLGFVVGTAFARNQSFVSFAGEGARADLFGVTMVRGDQLADQTLVVDHAVPHCDSREYFKSVIDGRAKAVYQGKIIVRPHAQKTDGRMMTQALLLSEEAEMANKPELEIFADDVQCAHGATSGQIDEDLLFYLRARGIPEAEARTLLVLAFLSEAIEEFGSESVTEPLEQRVRDWLAVGG
ncbi:Fe-S cluster assembly protein SufD [Polymorphum gilvum]|uniref:FeS assembly protein SufD n=1 Tax=Polymorphum gilvum (strain LMG 25793 / CGMCC 1.9160 / SL003B-26A1) TaxID=991905 RepID=F2J0V0_POLGS|nr:Fe-S cluster assembly protein SufD [Polymorphum gilvum]ADZ70786.1 FeS assembly protein SufD [Polymorphum gilvum SL003B-26A1]